MLNALSNAKLALESDDQAIIDQALATLQDTLGNLKEIPVVELDYSELDERIEIYSKLDFKLYTVESASVLQALIEQAKILSGNNPHAKQIITQEDIDILVEKMELAYETLKLVGEVEPEIPLIPLEPSIPGEPDIPLTPLVPSTPKELEVPLTPLEPAVPGEPKTGLPGTGVNYPYGIGLTVLVAGLAVIMISKVKRKEFE